MQCSAKGFKQSIGPGHAEALHSMRSKVLGMCRLSAKHGAKACRPAKRRAFGRGAPVRVPMHLTKVLWWNMRENAFGLRLCDAVWNRGPLRLTFFWQVPYGTKGYRDRHEPSRLPMASSPGKGFKTVQMEVTSFLPTMSGRIGRGFMPAEALT